MHATSVRTFYRSKSIFALGKLRRSTPLAVAKLHRQPQPISRHWWTGSGTDDFTHLASRSGIRHLSLSFLAILERLRISISRSRSGPIFWCVRSRTSSQRRSLIFLLLEKLLG